MLSEENSEVCKQAIVRALPCLEGAWFHVEDKARFVERWLSAAASLKYTQEIGQAVVEVLLRMVFVRVEKARHTGSMELAEEATTVTSRQLGSPGML